MKDSLKKIYPVAITVIITAVLSFMTSSAYYNGKLFFKPGGIFSFNSIESILDKYYYEDYSKEKAYESALIGYVASLGDPYSVYMTSDDLAEFNKLIYSNYYGIGVSVQCNVEDNTLLIVSVFDNSPAKGAGIAEGDIITKVNGVGYVGEQLEEATDAIKGEAGTEVVVTVLKKDTGKEVDLKIIREKIEIDTVKSEKLEGNIGYIEISQFSAKTALDFTESLDSLIAEGIEGLIVDVRDNSGGLTTSVEAIADCLLPKDTVIYYTADKYGNKDYVKCKIDSIDLPLVVIANENSASASEILVGAVKDNKRGIVVGQKTFGKGVVQQMFPLKNDAALKVTVEKYFTPNGDYIHEKGIEPDYAVELGEETDTQLEKALEILKNQ